MRKITVFITLMLLFITGFAFNGPDPTNYELSAIEETQKDGRQTETLSRIADIYYRIMLSILDHYDYYSFYGEDLNIPNMLDELDYLYKLDTELLKDFRISVEEIGDKLLYTVYYGGTLPEELRVEELRRTINIYVENVDVAINGDTVCMRILVE
ncbi:MAG TPA: hypothetical protein PK466_08760 [Thermotogota bacterium]|nr:hypothetical protein [Thermotogota bacterium]HPJ89211.1 hypothetical protein [Thermotogota bacterium]HPR96407.1 hypothetical protein [Thermotogota bacterium]